MNNFNKTTVRVCRLCLDSESSLYCIHENHLADKIRLFTGIMVSPSDELPQHICRCCKFLLHKFLKFRDRSVTAHSLLINALVMGQTITNDYIRSMDRVLLKLTLPFVTTKDVVDCLNNDYVDNKLVFTEEEIKHEHISKDFEEPFIYLQSLSAESYGVSESVTNTNLTQVDPLSDEKVNVLFTDTNDKISTNDLQNSRSLYNTSMDCWDGNNDVSCNIESNKRVNDDIANNRNMEYCNITLDRFSPEIDDYESGDEDTKIDIVENNPYIIEDKDRNDKFSLEVDDDDVNEQLFLSTLKINKETKIDLHLKLVAADKKFLEKYLKNLIQFKEQLSEEKQCQLERIQKVLRYNDSKFLKRLENRRRFSYYWFECDKKRAMLAKKYNMEIRLFNNKEQIEQFELRKQSDSYLNRPYKCNTCHLAFVIELTYKKHLKYHDPSCGPFKCNICHCYYPKRSKLKTHMELHKARFTCNQCGHVTNNWEMAKRHHLWHNGFKFKCKHCPKTYDRCSTYYMHVRVAHPALHDSCYICGEGFQGSLGLRMHIKKAHAQVESSKTDNSEDDVCQTGLRKCDECGESFADEELLSNHLKIHMKDFQCELCEMSFVNKLSLNVHKQRKHLNIVARRQLKLKHQDRFYTLLKKKKSGSTKKRERTRIMPRISLGGARPPFICDECGRVYNSTSNFLRHKHGHTGIKRFKCDICGRAMVIKANLKDHIQTVHMGYPHRHRSNRKRKQVNGKVK